jgi:phospholipid/cholesterol/gamma-HCH transport system ATP-binding protein
MGDDLEKSTNPVELAGVEKRFGKQVVYRDLDLSVVRGETLCVVGPSGVGKSVLLKLIIGLLKPERGKILVDGKDVVPLGERELRQVRRKVGMLFQGAALFDSLTVGENIAYGVREHYGWDEDKIRARVAECLDWVGLPGVEAQMPASLSGGMKKRVGLARVLAPGPEVILYDEPTTGLDPANTRRINELIKGLKARLGVTSIVITHDMPSVFAVADRVGLVAERRIPLVVGVEEARSVPELQRFVTGEEEAA